MKLLTYSLLRKKLIDQRVPGGTSPRNVERRHRKKMHKQGIRELIAAAPVYPGVGRWRERSGKRV